MKKLKKLAMTATVLLAVSAFSGCALYSYPPTDGQINYENPQWAPPYYPGARYYYLPDIECYFDLSSRDFIFLSNGQWIFSPNIPPIYAGFDLYDCFCIVLNIHVFQPWMHHQYYVSHYPRYYYRDYYDHSNIPYVRGFNENGRKAIFWKENERHRARNWDDRNLKDNRRFKYSREDRQQQNNQKPATPPSRPGTDNKQGSVPATSRSTQRTNYYGGTIGQPVRVEKQMRNQPATGTTERGRSTNPSEKRQDNQRRR